MLVHYQQDNTDNLSTNTLRKYINNQNFLKQFNQTIDEKGVFDEDIRLNLSLSGDIPEIDKAKLNLYSQNLLNLTDNKRQKVNVTSQELPALGWVGLG
jgi:hypothetical protein